MARIDAALRKALTGISGILVTPFDKADAIAPARLAPIVDRAVKAGVHILVANGNTGEFYALSTQEAEAMVHAAAEHIDGRVPLIGGVGRSIVDACKLARASRAAGAAALDGASAAGPVRLAARRRRLHAATRRGSGRPAAAALSSQRRHRPRRHRGAVPRARRGRRQVGVARRRFALPKRSAVATPRSSGSTASPSRGRRRSSPSARAASPPA